MYVIPTILGIVGIILPILLIIFTKNKKDNNILDITVCFLTACCFASAIYGITSTYTVNHTNYSIKLDREYKNKRLLITQRNHTKKDTYAYETDTKPIKQINHNIKQNQLFAKCKRHPYKYAWILG